MSEDLRATILELRDLIAADPGSADLELVREGEKIVSVFFDQNFGPSVANYESLRSALLEKAALDMSSGGILLKGYRVGIVYHTGRLKLFTAAYGDPDPGGTLVASVSLKAARAFERHRERPAIEFTDDDVKSTVYSLIYRMARG